MMRVVEIGLPVLLSIFSIFFLLRYSLTEKRSHEIKDLLKQRNEARSREATRCARGSDRLSRTLALRRLNRTAGSDCRQPLNSSHELHIKDNHFYLNNRKVFLNSGEIHYFRIKRELWDKHLEAAREAGLTTVSTYVPWAWHESRGRRF